MGHQLLKMDVRFSFIDISGTNSAYICTNKSYINTDFYW